MEKKFLIVDKYLYLPIQTGCERMCLEIFCQKDSSKEKLFEFQIPVGKVTKEEYPADYYARFPVKKFTDETLILKGDMPEAFFKACRIAGEEALLEGEPGACNNTCHRHPSIHFTAETGWINDPNGLVYKDGIYHLYFQYNPFDIQWENMSWGHAISSDLLHWEQLDAVLFPDENGAMFSGCGIVNEREMLGLPADALLFFYTTAGGANTWSAGRNFAQRVAYSIDNGNTLIKSDLGVLDTICCENRDPKVFWHERSHAYIMVLWLEKNDFGIFRSEDLENWEESDRLTLQDAWECPDLVELFDEKGDGHWMFWCADGYYFWGEFDGYRFVTDGVRHKAYMNKIPYAAQTYSGVMGRKVQIPWLRLPNRGGCYTGAMGIPRELGVSRRNGILVLTQRYVGEFEKRRHKVALDDRKEGMHILYEKAADFPLELVTRCRKDAEICRWRVNGTEVSYVPATGMFTVGEETCALWKHIRDFSFVVDDVIFEVTVDCGTITGAFELKDSKVEIAADEACCDELLLYEIH